MQTPIGTNTPTNISTRGGFCPKADGASKMLKLGSTTKRKTS